MSFSLNKKYFATIFGLLLGIVTNAQDYILNEASNGAVVSTCSGSFADSGNEMVYGNNADYQMTFCSPNENGCLSIFFEAFELENNWDFLDVFDGADTDANLIGSFTGSQSPGLINSSTGCLTFRFSSDNDGSAAGWNASISCTDCAGFGITGGEGFATGCPNIDIGPDFDVDCQDNCVTLNASVLETGLTTEYAVSAIEYNPPFAFNEGTGFSIGTDDVWSSALDLPFNFCYFGDTYSQVTVGSNGLMSFNMEYAGNYCPWSFNQPCPNPGLPLNSIFGVYHDIDPSVCGDAKYAILGEEPCRVFVLNFDNVCHFSCNNLTSTTQVVLYETTNIIEVYVEDKPTCPNWNSGNAVIGIQDMTGTQGYVAPGRQTGPWSASEEAWRFTPSGEPNFQVSWYDQDNTLIGNGMSIDVCVPPVGATYFAEVLYTSCDGSEIAESDEVNIGIDFETNVEIDPVICPTSCDAVITVEPQTGIPPYTFDIGDGPQDSGTFTDLCPGIYEIIIVDSIGCTAGVIVEVDQPEIPNPGQDATYFVCESDGPFNMTENLNGNPDDDGQWFDAQMNPVSNIFDPAQNESGLYTYVVGVEPCDTSATLDVIITPTEFTEVEAFICEGNSYTLPDNSQVEDAGEYETVLQSMVSGCDSVITTTLIVNPVFESEVPAGLCGGEAFELPNGESVTEPGSYTVVLQSSEGCDSTITFNVTVVTVDAGEYDPICTGQFSLNLSGSTTPEDPDATLTWTGSDNLEFADANNPNTLVTASEGGAYTIELTDSRCPDDPATSLVIMRTPPEVEFQPEFYELCLDETQVIEPILTGDYAEPPYVWNDTHGFYTVENDSAITVIAAGYENHIDLVNTITVIVPGLDPCPSAIGTVEVSVISCELTIPNIFTPNGDGINDAFVIEGIEYFPGSSMRIFNRWGKVVYQSDSYGSPFWRGENYRSGVECADGIYFYELIVPRLDLTEKGTITLARNRFRN